MAGEVRYSAADGSYYVEIEGLQDLMKWAKDADKDLKKAMSKGLKTAATPVLEKARANAQVIADDGTFAQSLSISQRKNGSQYVLRSTDPAAPVKEYARIGAKTRTSKGTPLADARLAKRSGVGVPLRANAPRVMIPAINDSVDEVKAQMEKAINEVLEEAGRG